MDEYKRATDRLNEIATLIDNWNANGAEAFSSNLIEKCKRILSKLPYAPEIYSTAINAIQFDYSRSNGDSLGLEIYEDRVRWFKVQTTEFGIWADGEIYEDKIDQIVSLVEQFMKN